MILHPSWSELNDKLRSSRATEELSHLHNVEAIIVEPEIEDTRPPYLPQCPIIALDSEVHSRLVDIAVETEDELEKVLAAIAKFPVASQTLVQLLRHNEDNSITNGLFAESLAYSTLQHGAEFLNWLQQHRRKPVAVEKSPPIVIERDGHRLTLTLNRPRRRNAWSVEMRDALTEALEIAESDKTIQSIQIDANGPCFSAGGDLDEFGLARDAATAHMVRSIRNPGRLMSRLDDRISAHLHGACVGAGIEIPAFAKHLTARSDTFFLLPELSMGLIPGAGGTASILRRIGRQRLGFMAIAGIRIDPQRALRWKLIDEIVA